MSAPSEGFHGALGTTVVVAGGGSQILVYNGTPGPGTLIFAVSSSAGTDAYGNTFKAGINYLVTLLDLEPGGLLWGINNAFGPPGISYVAAGGPGTAGQLHIDGQGGQQFIELDDFDLNCTIESGLLQWINSTPGSGSFILGLASTGMGNEQHGTFSATFAGVSSLSGSFSFPAGAFSSAPVIIGAVQIGSNFDVLLNWQTVSASTAGWRLFQKSGTNITGTAIVHWWAVNTVAL